MFQTILLAYNGTDEGQAGLLACAEIAAFSKVETHLVAVVQLPTSSGMTEGLLPLPELIKDEEKRMQEILNDGVEQLRQKGFSVTGHLSLGEPVDGICRMAKELNADLIVVGHMRKTSFASRWWAGSVGKSLLDHAPCSLLIARIRA